VAFSTCSFAILVYAQIISVSQSIFKIDHLRAIVNHHFAHFSLSLEMKIFVLKFHIFFSCSFSVLSIFGIIFSSTISQKTSFKSSVDISIFSFGFSFKIPLSISPLGREEATVFSTPFSLGWKGWDRGFSLSFQFKILKIQIKKVVFSSNEFLVFEYVSSRISRIFIYSEILELFFNSSSDLFLV
jgi:hypothetical protein